MLTEGTDVPDVQSVFLTRQTTSEVLVTQMVGRALRGTKFGGTTAAYIVSFVDQWRQFINWAGYDKLLDGGLDDTAPEYGKRPPWSLISIDLVRRLARQMDSGVNVELRPFLAKLPVGWYRVEYLARSKGADDTEARRALVMVFEHEQQAFMSFVEFVAGQPLEDFSDESLSLDDVRPVIRGWKERFFPGPDDHIATSLDADLFDIGRHVAYTGQPPRFFPFDERRVHDLDVLAREVIERDLGPREADSAIRAEYNRVDRFWATLYYPYSLFKSQFNACCERLLQAEAHGADPATFAPPPMRSESLPRREPSEEVKRQVRRRDGESCLCCGEQSTRLLQVDHIHAYHFGGSNIIDNLQTLCSSCNSLKGTATINFLDPQTDLTQPLESFAECPLPRADEAGAASGWIKFLARSISFFYRCGAVDWVKIAERGPTARHWTVHLKVGNDPRWMEPHLPRLLSRIRSFREENGYNGPDTLTVTAPDASAVSHEVDDDDERAAPHGPEDLSAEELADFTVAEARHRRAQHSIAELIGLPEDAVDRRLAEAHGRALLRGLFAEQWPQAPKADAGELGRLSVVQAREGRRADQIAEVTGYSLATVNRRLAELHGKTLVANAFAERWPGNEGIDELGNMTVAEARDRGMAAGIARITHLNLDDVVQQLGEFHGKMLVRNGFARVWPGMHDTDWLGRMSVAEVRDRGLEATIARLTGFTASTVERRLRDEHGKTLLRNLFDGQWPTGE